MSLNSLGKSIEKLLALPQLRQPTDYRLSPEWEGIQAIVLRTVAAFPDAEIAVFAAMTAIEQMNGYPDCEPITGMVYQALKPFMDARVAIASALVEAAKEAA